MDQLVETTKLNMQRVLDVLKVDLSTVRTGRATPSLIDSLTVGVYGGSTKLKLMELATITTSDTQTLVVVPFDPSIIGEIRKGILELNVGLNPVIDGQIIRISIPPLSEERRNQLIHLMKQKLEGGKIQVRQVRHEAMDAIKKQYNAKEVSEDEMVRLEKEIQRTTDEVINEIDALGSKKEQELLQI